MDHLKLQLHGYRLTTAEILYHLPDYPELLQSYIWQEYDQVPSFPILRKFLKFWKENLDGSLHSVTLASVEIVRPTEYDNIDELLRVH
ncbi:MAG: Usg family protein [Alphaproteobacteria bacterium]|nr:Usg family protein [Alphaproteobacteria bacterium]NCQ67228.1 Usg family protein [Alphaproteobacteria bacterium]NCT07072.1 Usg family protein [Alphaproteobacteria bacterium]